MGTTMRCKSFRRSGRAAVALAALLLAAGSAASLRAEPLRLGAAWYPEQWPQTRWDADLALMEAAHIDVVRISEFAWSRLEPQEGVYDFAWLDAAIAAAAKHHIAVVLGTPTAAPPAWLTGKYPDTLAVDEQGVRAEHGERQQFSFASARYRGFARDIAGRMAERYGRDPRVIGWQIDNELAVDSFDPEARAQFHAWLKARYGTVANLNARWTTAYWSQTYDSFDQVPMHLADENPALLLDLKRFITDTWVGYVDNQVQAIRAHGDGRQFITTNTMGWNAGFDHYALHRGLDMAAWDEYIPDGHYNWRKQAVQQDLVRGYKQKNFWLMETQPAFVNWWSANRALDPGQTREVAWQAVAHGADAVLYWQWRSALNGQEQYHGVLVGADGTPVPVYDEVARTGAEFARASAVLDGTSPHAAVAMLQDYDSRWAIDFQRHTKSFDPVAEFDAFYNPLEDGAQAVDVVSPLAGLDRYKLVVAPALNVLTAAEAKRLRSYVEGGGHLVLGPRSGMKDADNALNVQRQPGPLADLLGARVGQFYVLDSPAPVAGELGSGEATVWAETLEPRAAYVQVLMRYGKTGSWLDGRPAVVTRKVGRGSITYVGAWLDAPLMQALAKRLLGEAGVAPILAGVPADVEVAQRDGGGRKVLILINHGNEAHEVALPAAMTDVLGGGEVKAAALPAHGVSVLTAKGS
jgi:beta-galactosidase